MAFTVGMKVVCVAVSTTDAGRDEQFPVRGEVYTIREILPSLMRPDEAVVRLVEIENYPRQYIQGFGELKFRASRFRPLVSRKTDISIFKAMLKPNRVNA